MSSSSTEYQAPNTQPPEMWYGFIIIIASLVHSCSNVSNVWIECVYCDLFLPFPRVCVSSSHFLHWFHLMFPFRCDFVCSSLSLSSYAFFALFGFFLSIWFLFITFGRFFHVSLCVFVPGALIRFSKSARINNSWIFRSMWIINGVTEHELLTVWGNSSLLFHFVYLSTFTLSFYLSIFVSIFLSQHFYCIYMLHFNNRWILLSYFAASVAVALWFSDLAMAITICS